MIMNQNQEEAELNLDLPEVKEGEEDTTDWKAEATKLREKAIAQRERTKALKEQLKSQTIVKAEDKPVKPDDSRLLEKAYLRSAGITTEDEVELALSVSKKWDMPIDKLVDDEDFKVKIEKLRTQKSNEIATSNIRGGAGKSQAKETPEYWSAKGTVPSRTDVPDRKTRVGIVKAIMANSKNNKTFYND